LLVLLNPSNPIRKIFFAFISLAVAKDMAKGELLIFFESIFFFNLKKFWIFFGSKVLSSTKLLIINLFFLKKILLIFNISFPAIHKTDLADKSSNKSIFLELEKITKTFLFSFKNSWR